MAAKSPSGTAEVRAEEEFGDRVHRLLVPQFGTELADDFVRQHRAQRDWAREHHPDEGQRERRKRVTRQRISDVAVALFAARGFDHVSVSDIAEIAGVSEKTVHSYFPTKESMVFALADEAADRLLSALRERGRGEAPTTVIVAALERDLDRFLLITAGGDAFMPVYAEMIFSHPALRAAWLELHERFVAVVCAELAAAVEVDPRDPEPQIAARAIVGLQDVWFQSLRRRIAEGSRGPDLRADVLSDLHRAARLLDSGLSSLDLFPDGRHTRTQLQEAAHAVEQARAQVLTAVKQARTAWGLLRREQAPPGRATALAPTAAAVDAAAVTARAAKRTATRPARVAGEAATGAARAATGAGRGAGREAVRAARKTQRTLRSAPGGTGRAERDKLSEVVREEQRKRDADTRAARRKTAGR